MENNTNKTVQEPNTVKEDLEDKLIKEKDILESGENQLEAVLGISDDNRDSECDKDADSDHNDVSVDKDTSEAADDCGVNLDSGTTDADGELEDSAETGESLEGNQNSQREAPLDIPNCDKEPDSDVTVDRDTTAAGDCVEELDSETTDTDGQLENSAKTEDSIETEQNNEREAALIVPDSDRDKEPDSGVTVDRNTTAADDCAVKLDSGKTDTSDQLEDLSDKAEDRTEVNQNIQKEESVIISDSERDKDLNSDVSVDRDTTAAVKLDSGTTDAGGQLEDSSKIKEGSTEIDQHCQTEATLNPDTNSSESNVDLAVNKENGDTNVNTVNQEDSDECTAHEEHVCVNKIEEEAEQNSDEAVDSTAVEEFGKCECNKLCEKLDEASVPTETTEQNSETSVEAVVHLDEKDMGANSSSDEGSAKDKDDRKGDKIKMAESDINPEQNETHSSTIEEGYSSNVDSVNEQGEDAKLENVVNADTNSGVSETAKSAEHTNSEEIPINKFSSDVDINKSEEKVNEENLITSANTVESTSSDSTKCGIVHSGVQENLVVCQSESTGKTDASTDTCRESEMTAVSNDKTSANAITNTDTVIILEVDSEIKKTPKVDKETYTEGNTELELEKVQSKALKLESEARMLREELAGMRVSLKASQGHMQQQQARYNEKVMSLKLELYRSQTALKQQRAKSDSQLADVISHLALLEGQLKKEQWKVKGEIRHKNEVIENQKKEIVKLKDQNEQLLNAIKEICANGGMNGYMRENKQRNVHFANGFEPSGKSGKDKKSHNGKLGSKRDKFSWKNRSSLELGNLNLEKYLIQQERLCSSQEDLQNIGTGQDLHVGMIGRGPGDRFRSASVSGRPIPNRSQNFFDPDLHNGGVSKSLSESSQLSDMSNTSGMYSMSDHDDSITNGNHYEDDDDDDDRHFSFSSTHINMVIDEEDTIGPIMSHSGQMMSMGSMPTLANIGNDDPGQRLYSAKNRPHSLSSVDLVSIQQQARNLAESPVKSASPGSSTSTPPPSPSYVQSKSELTPFQTFKTMFKRKGSKNKGNKKRSVSLSQTTNKEYSEALKKHFQKYDMS